MYDMPRSSFLTAPLQPRMTTSLLGNIYHRQKFDVNCFLTIYLCVTKVGADIYHVGRLIFGIAWASDDAPWLCAHMFSLFDDSDTIDEDIVHSYRELVRVLECRSVTHGI